MSLDTARIERAITTVALRESPEDERDYIYAPTIPVDALPANIDQGPRFPRVQNQGRVGLCTGATVTTLCESIENTTRPYVPGVTDLSERFNYKFSREYDDIVGDGGATPKSAMRSGKNIGLPRETSWPFSENIDEVPPQAVMDEAAQARIGRYELLQPVLTDSGWIDWRGTLTLMRQAMAEGCRVALAFRVRRWMTQISGPLGSAGHTSPPMSVTDPRNEVLGGHMVPVRRIDMDMLPASGGAIVIHNSWGVEWGDKGLWSMPAIMLADPALFMECRIIRSFAGIEVAPVTEPALTPQERDAHLAALAALGIWPAPHPCAYPAAYEYLRRRGVSDLRICDLVGVSPADFAAFRAAAPLAAWAAF